jgi:glycosyltransferase involved in cell wall biosynthesis
MKVLFLDIEGGHGGSSKSLFELVKNIVLIDENVKIDVWCKKKGEIHNKYKEVGVFTRVVSSMPKVRAVPRFSRNVWMQIIFFLIHWPKSRKFRRELLEESRNVDLIHFNHEGLYWLAFWLSRRTKVAMTMHIRTNPWDSFFARLQVKVIDNCTSSVIFITENEKKRYVELGGSEDHGVVIYNSVEIGDNNLHSPRPSLGSNFIICALANYSYLRGLDLLIDVAICLKKIKATKVKFIIAGDISLTKSLPGKLGEIGRRKGDLSDYAKEMKVDDMFIFLGHVSNTKRVLLSSNLLVRPNREKNPWGRDILEALSLGVPVVSSGTYNKFVENGVTGILLDDFIPCIVAREIVKLSKNTKLMEIMSVNGINRVKKLCNGVDRGFDTLNFWENEVKKVKSNL